MYFLDQLIDIDNHLLLWLNSFHHDSLDAFMKAFSGRFVWIPMYATVLYMLFRTFPWRTALMFTFGFAITILIADQLCATFIRPEVARLRPANLSNPISPFVHIVNGYRGGSYGFPSCHAANSFAFATFLSLIFKRRSLTIFVMAWALFNSYTRIYLGVHYPGDIIVGGIIGALIGVCVYYSLMALQHRIHLRHSARKPQMHRYCLKVAKREICFVDTDWMMLAGTLITIYLLIVYC